MLLATLLLSVIPIGIEFVSPSAAFCGPINDRISMYSVLNNYIQRAPKALAMVVSVLSNTWLQWGAILALLLGVVVMQAKLKQTNAYARLTKRELEMSRRLLVHKDGPAYGRLSIEEDVGIDIH